MDRLKSAAVARFSTFEPVGKSLGNVDCCPRSKTKLSAAFIAFTISITVAPLIFACSVNQHQSSLVISGVTDKDNDALDAVAAADRVVLKLL